MKLEESDVRAIANNRFWSKARYLKFMGVLFGVIVVSLVVMALTKSSLALLVFVPAFVYLALELRIAAKFQKQLLEQWKVEQSQESHQ